MIMNVIIFLILNRYDNHGRNKNMYNDISNNFFESSVIYTTMHSDLINHTCNILFFQPGQLQVKSNCNGNNNISNNIKK